MPAGRAVPHACRSVIMLHRAVNVRRPSCEGLSR